MGTWNSRFSLDSCDSVFRQLNWMLKVELDIGQYYFLNDVFHTILEGLQNDALIFSISNLYKWRYNNLGDLPHVKTEAEYQLANPGFSFEYQVVNVENYSGIGESEPSPYFFQVSKDLNVCKTAYIFWLRILLLQWIEFSWSGVRCGNFYVHEAFGISRW